jgi:hypothetical protein
LHQIYLQGCCLGQGPFLSVGSSSST